MAVVEVRGQSYYMNEKLKVKWDKIKGGLLAKVDEDRCYIVDGRERSGKSLWTLQQAAYIDPTILDDAPDGTLLPRITFSVEETLKAIRETKSTKDHTRVIIFDEAFRGLSSKSVISKVNKMITSALQEMGQNNLVLFIVSPSFYMLEIYAAVLRSQALFHIVKDKKTHKRFFKAFNEKKKGTLYQQGARKGWHYKLKTNIKDYFFNKYPGGPEFEARYRKKKHESLCTLSPEKEKEVKEDTKYRDRFEKLIWLLHYKLGMTYRTISNEFKLAGIDLRQTTITETGQKCPTELQKQLIESSKTPSKGILKMNLPINEEDDGDDMADEWFGHGKLMEISPTAR